MTWDQLLLFLPAAALVAASPGANNLLSLVNGARAGLRATVFSLLGRLTAFAILIAAVAMGLGAVLAASELAFVIVKWLGVAYLTYLGLKLWTSRQLDLGETEVEASQGGIRTPGRTWNLARKEFLVAMTNPKAILLFTAFLPQFVVPEAPASTQLLWLGALYIPVEFCAACLYATAGSSVRRLRLTAARLRLLNRVAGGMMLAAAALLASSRRTA
ncbi:LysE family translocator [Algihabitans albus]|uniref:LysE family translocator n=1 Tax=Algihabitans albus TaxID=2164067 RepID=UPI000E5CC4B2|nr:LysE family translocator [Algihabitans albus]